MAETGVLRVFGRSGSVLEKPYVTATDALERSVVQIEVSVETMKRALEFRRVVQRNANERAAVFFLFGEWSRRCIGYIFHP